MNNKEQVYPNIKDIEKTYVERLEQGNQIDETEADYPETIDSDVYGRFTEDEVNKVIRELKRTTAAGTEE